MRAQCLGYRVLLVSFKPLVHDAHRPQRIEPGRRFVEHLLRARVLDRIKVMLFGARTIAGQRDVTGVASANPGDDWPWILPYRAYQLNPFAGCVSKTHPQP